MYGSNLHSKQFNAHDIVSRINVLSQHHRVYLGFFSSRQSFGLIRPLLKLLHPSKTVIISQLIFLSDCILTFVEVSKRGGSERLRGGGGRGGGGGGGLCGWGGGGVVVFSFLSYFPTLVCLPVIA